MNLLDCAEIACAPDMKAFEAHLVRFANQLGFGLMTGALILEQVDGSARSLPFGNIPEAYRSTSASVERGKRDPVMHRLKRLRVPFAYDQSMYVEEGAADIWEVQAQYGYKTGLALRLSSGDREHLIIGVDRDAPLPGDSCQLTRMTADFHLYAAHAHVAAQRLLGSHRSCLEVRPTLTARELEILRWTGDGKSAWAVGQIINTSEHNVNYHLRRIMTKLSVASKYQAAAKARALGLL